MNNVAKWDIILVVYVCSRNAYKCFGYFKNVEFRVTQQLYSIQCTSRSTIYLFWKWNSVVAWLFFVSAYFNIFQFETESPYMITKISVLFSWVKRLRPVSHRLRMRHLKRFIGCLRCCLGDRTKNLNSKSYISCFREKVYPLGPLALTSFKVR